MIIDDESVQSYLYRKIFRGFLSWDTANFVTDDGQWVDRPSISAKYAFMFENVSDESLMNAVIHNRFINLSDDSLYSHPECYYRALKNVFFRGKTYRTGVYGFPIKFCPHCVKRFIVDNGFGYFRKSWTDSSVNFCELHQTYLYYLRPFKRKTALQDIAVVLSGSIPVNAEHMSGDILLEPALTKVNIFPVKISSDAILELAQFIAAELPFQTLGISECEELEWMSFASYLRLISGMGLRDRYHYTKISGASSPIDLNHPVLISFIREKLHIAVLGMGRSRDFKSLLLTSRNVLPNQILAGLEDSHIKHFLSVAHIENAKLSEMGNVSTIVSALIKQGASLSKPTGSIWDGLQFYF